MRRRLRIRILALPVLVAVAIPAVALAAALGVTSSKLTVRVSATSIPPTTCTLSASADTYADELLPLANFGGSVDLLVNSAELENARAFVRFDLSSCSPSIPSAAEVESATLRLHLASAPSSGRTYEISNLASDWGESTLTWLDQPAADKYTTKISTGTTSGVTLSANVLTDVARHVAGTKPNYGWRIADDSEGALIAQEAALGARESGNAPQLEVVYYP